MKRLYSYLKNKYFHENLDLRVQSFNLLALAGMAAGVVVALSCVWTNAGAVNIVLNLAASVLAFILLRFTGRWKKLSYRVSSWIIVAGVFVLFFTFMFFTAGGYRSGMPCFFVFALIFTAIMLENRERVAALIVEFLLYVSCCLVAYYRPETVKHFQTEFDYAGDVIVGITAASVLLLLVVLLHIRIYRERQLQIGELNRELEARNETLERYNRMKSDFLAAVAHEVSGPLAVISASSADTIALLTELPAPPAHMNEITENHERIERRVNLLDRVILDLMDTAAIENGRLSLSRQNVKLADFLKTVCDAGFKHSDKNNNRTAYDFQPDLPYIWLDPTRIEQVMTNLISNAVRHTKDGVITVKLTRTDKTQTVSVSDNGEGMDADIAAVVLKQYAPSVQGEYWRHGIGLFLCRQIIVSHGGEIWIETEKGRGTTVSFELREESGES